jgi:tetratricopeptide (TPR) repeat protein
MSEPSRDAAPPAESLSDAEREARIEQLLVAGLDDYFDGRLDQAINVWTRVLFLDRSNDRARAYIDRARRAQAERQRESEALMHQGLQAFDEGDVERARGLLTAAVERGAPHEQALPVLHRIGLLDVPAAAGQARSRTPGRAVSRPSPPSRGWWPVAAVLIAMVAAATAVYLSLDGPAPTALTPAAIDRVPALVPVPGAMEGHLARARQLFDAGKLPDALAVLDRIDAGDAAFAEARALRARVQQELLRSATPMAVEAGTR